MSTDETADNLKQRIRASLDILENYLDPDGTLNIGKVTRRIEYLELRLERAQNTIDQLLAAGQFEEFLVAKLGRSDMAGETINQWRDAWNAALEAAAALPENVFCSSDYSDLERDICERLYRNMIKLKE